MERNLVIKSGTQHPSSRLHLKGRGKLRRGLVQGGGGGRVDLRYKQLLNVTVGEAVVPPGSNTLAI